MCGGQGEESMPLGCFASCFCKLQGKTCVEVKEEPPNSSKSRLFGVQGAGFRGSKRHHLFLPTRAVGTGGVQPSKMPDVTWHVAFGSP